MQLKTNYTDDRGTITDLLVTPDYSITHITFKKGAIRGNHLHKKTLQVDYILKGKLTCVNDGYRFIVSVGDRLDHFKNEKHAYKALVNSEMVSICFGLRKGTDYEKDTFRLEGKDKLL